ncbi:unannotated protein [freshwater metagenome]|uniref:Unannotated protein n=1 Tax=freshwater metagenome TaxID=449393 RepID=A0A6J5YRD6_9ZZZZ|nr:hypothetical protein [Actinomycetota bacterium]
MKRVRGRLALSLSILAGSLVGVELPAAVAGTTYTFTTAGASGRTGPTQSQVTTAYASTNLAGAVTINTQGIQEWTVPFSGQFRITAKGAAGGNGYYSGSQSGGYGAQTIGTFSLTSGTVLKVLVGQLGGSRVTNGGGGGGGGSFVVTGSGTILAIAGGGGGGGGRNPTTGVNASLTTTATSDGSGLGTAGTSGGGGAPFDSVWCGAGAGGYSGNGVGVSNCLYVAGNSFTNGGIGGDAIGTYPTAGGFGGGGGVGYAGGGGGGYNGAPGGRGDAFYPGGGGGSTFNSGSDVTTSQLTALADGGVTIEFLGSIGTISVVAAGNVKSTNKGIGIALTATLNSAGRVTFYANGKRIPGCINQSASIGNKVCTWKPTGIRDTAIYATLSQNGSVVAVSSTLTISGTKRTGPRG